MTQLAEFTFDENKASEVAFFFLQRAQEGGLPVTSSRLLQWLYLAEREAYARHGEPLTGSRMRSGLHGPVLEDVRRLVATARSQPGAVDGPWSRVVQAVPCVTRRASPRRAAVTLGASCPHRSSDDLLSLSASDLDLLEAVWTDASSMSAKALAKAFQNPRRFPESAVRRNEGFGPISLERVFDALGCDRAETRELIAHIRRFEHVERVFRGL